ncbi:Putative transmembrane protein [Rubellimicrobium mesophilum DSM 19309]|uniref:Putative transmembrane protein n=1 Tax=Rubellimicrobium mesophilum DSM 19309 TaxID=442562 RepID=A0A017HPW6_9RHOB|nr:DUF924 family protein [Rubellimicrobium mesophilum]EYD75809.1 Putative transmembrane protein [Rubellimicrobium mesophilum DSM 19309]
MMLPGAKDVLDFWLHEVGEDGWFGGGDELDRKVRDRFLPVWEAAMEGRLGLWLTTPREALAYVILLDQFPRNMFRGDPRSFASDPLARAAAKTAINRDWDLRVTERERVFFYLPLEHSENLVDQDRCVRLTKARMPELGAEYLLHARAHREQIRRFGRFPTRNEILRRPSTPEEAEFLARGGYPALVKEMGAEAA